MELNCWKNILNIKNISGLSIFVQKYITNTEIASIEILQFRELHIVADAIQLGYSDR